MTERLRAVLDTNVFVSALLSHNPTSPTREINALPFLWAVCGDQLPMLATADSTVDYLDAPPLIPYSCRGSPVAQKPSCHRLRAAPEPAMLSASRKACLTPAQYRKKRKFCVETILGTILGIANPDE